MKKFNMKVGIFLKDNNTTTKIMYTYLIIFSIFIIFSSFKNGIYPLVKGYGNLYTVFKPLIMIIIASISSFVFEYIYYMLIGKKKSIYNLFAKEFTILPMVIICLIIPINTPIYMLIISSFIVSLYKVLIGGYAHNKINLVLIGTLFILIIMPINSYLNLYENSLFNNNIGSISNYGFINNYETLIKPFGGLFNYLIGNIPGGNGITCNLLIIIFFIYLVYKRQIKWEITLSIILSTIIIYFIICIINNIGVWFIIYNLLSGGFLFGATFVATDYITSPVTKINKVIYGLLISIVTIIIRYYTFFSNGIFIAILIVNILFIVINYIRKYLYK